MFFYLTAKLSLISQEEDPLQLCSLPSSSGISLSSFSVPKFLNIITHLNIQQLPHWLSTSFHSHSHTCTASVHKKNSSPDWKVEDLSAGSPHVASHFDQLLFEGVCVLGQLVQAKGPVCPPSVQLGLHRLWKAEAEGSASRLGLLCLQTVLTPQWH